MQVVETQMLGQVLQIPPPPATRHLWVLLSLGILYSWGAVISNMVLVKPARP